MSEDQRIENTKTGIVMLLNTRPDEAWDYFSLARALNVEWPDVADACRQLDAEGVVEISVNLPGEEEQRE